MNGIKVLALLLILGGIFGLVNGSFSYTKESHDAKIGPLELSIKDKERVHIPEWIAAAAIGGGVLLLIFDRKPA